MNTNLIKNIKITIIVLTMMVINISNAAFIEPTVAPASSDQDFLQNILGANNNNNDFDSTTVVANNDGSLIERLEYIITSLATLWTKSGSDLYYTTGNIGIGTSSPSALLEISGTGQQAIKVTDETNSITTGIWSGTGQGLIGTYTNTDLRLITNGSSRVTIDTTGNIGIGTTGPGNRLDIKSSGFSTSPFAVRESADENYLLELYGDADGDGVLRIYDKTSTNPIALTSNGASYFNGGNVGIGTTTPSAVLDVEGGIKLANDIDTCDEIKAGTIRWDGSTFQGCDGTDWVVLNRDETPTAFEFTDQTGVALGTLTESNILQITGINVNSTVSISGDGTPAYRICADSGCSSVTHTWSTSAGTIDNNEYLQLRLTSNASVSTTNSASIIVGTGIDSWSVTTGAAYMTATGGTITTSGDYKIHSFTSSGTFTVTATGLDSTFGEKVEYLVVAGGGGGTQCGGGNAGAGGGAGGMRYSASPGTPDHVVTEQAYSITVGAGGAAGNSNGALSGGNSVFDTITSTGGGAAHGSGGGFDGGSGGGAGSTINNQGGGAGNTPSTSPIQGYGGGTNTASANYSSGGGGGRSGVGTDAIGAQSGSGGNGLANSITGSSITYSGGGGASGTNYSNESVQGVAGSGNGGAPGNVTTENATEPTANRGGGGSGGFLDMDFEDPDVYGLGSSGASGVVIIRYKYQ